MCTDISNFQIICGTTDAAQSIPADAQFRISGLYPLFFAGSAGMPWVKAMLALKVPVILSITVPPTGMDADEVDAEDGTNGIVTFNPGALVGNGGHCMLLVGWMPNSALPAGMPQPPFGTGYFICKNSWSSGYGDGGYIYLSDTWVSWWARSLYVISDVTEG